MATVVNPYDEKATATIRGAIETMSKEQLLRRMEQYGKALLAWGPQYVLPLLFWISEMQAELERRGIKT